MTDQQDHTHVDTAQDDALVATSFELIAKALETLVSDDNTAEK